MVTRHPARQPLRGSPPRSPAAARSGDRPGLAVSMGRRHRPQASMQHLAGMGIGILAKEKPHLILLDLVMPDTDGYNVCNFLRNRSTFRKTPIIMLTSWDNTINRVRAKLVGVSDFLAKPFEAEQLLQLIKKYLPADGQE